MKQTNRNQSASDVADVELLRKFKDMPGVWITFAGAAYYGHYHEMLSEIGMKPSWVTALAFIEQYPGITQSELGRHLKINRASAMTVSNALEEMGLITREKVAKLNQTALHITASGEDKLAQSCRIESQISDALLSEHSPKERALLMKLLRSITLKLNNKHLE